MKKVATTKSKNLRFEKESKALKKNLEKRKQQETELKKLKEQNSSSDAK